MSEILAYKLNEQVISLFGDDAKSYLHGQTTQDINQVNQQQYLWAGHCNAKGKMWSVARVYQHNSHYGYLTSPDELNASLPELKKYAVFSKVTIEHDENKVCVGFKADNLASICSALSIDFNDNNATDCDLGKVLKVDEFSVILITTSEQLSVLDAFAKWQSSNQPWYTHLIQLGQPRMNSTAISEYVPQMLNLQAIGGISFTKGCYTGQETVARMKYLGKNKRAMAILKADATISDDAPELEIQLGENWRRAGNTIELAHEQDSTYLLAVLPNDITSESNLRTKHSEVPLSLCTLPYTLED